VEGIQTATSHGKGNQALDLSLNQAARSWHRRQRDVERIGQPETADQSGVSHDELAAFALGQGDREAVARIDSNLAGDAKSARPFETVVEFP
jgi:hypothetical protein